jgi:hypothetical protein
MGCWVLSLINDQRSQFQDQSTQPPLLFNHTAMTNHAQEKLSTTDEQHLISDGSAVIRSE